MKVEIFRNSEESLWAIKPLTGPLAGRVSFSSREAFLGQAHIVVDEKLRQKALEDDTRLVHTRVVGDLIEVSGFVGRFITECPVEEAPLVETSEGCTELQWSSAEQKLFITTSEATEDVTPGQQFLCISLLDTGQAYGMLH